MVVVAGTGAAIVGSGGSSPDAAAPSLFMTAPANGSTVSGTVTVSATCGDNVGCARVQFKLNGANLGAEDTSAPFSISWDSSVSGTGTFTLSAQAYDAANNASGLATSETVTVNPPSVTDVANVFVAANGNDSGVNCVRNATPIAPPADPTTMCATLDKAAHLAAVGDVGRVACGVYSGAAGTFTRDATKEAAAQGTYVTFQPPPGQTAPGYANALFDTGFISGCVQLTTIDTSYSVSDYGPTHLAFQDMAASTVKLGKNVSSATYQGTVTDIKLTNVVTYNLLVRSAVRVKLIGGQIGNMTSCGTTPSCVGYTSRTNGFTTLSTANAGAENYIACSTSCAVPSTDILIDGVTFHDVYHNAAGSAHSACIWIGAVRRLTIRKSHFYNCDSETIFMSYETTGTITLANPICQECVFENNWIDGSTEGGATSTVTYESVDMKTVGGGGGYTYKDIVWRNNVVAGGFVWSTDNGLAILATNIYFIGNLWNSQQCSGTAAPTSGVTWSYTLYLVTAGSCNGSGNALIGAFPLVTNASPDESANNFDITAASTPIDFVPASAYALPTTFTTAFGLEDPAAVLTTDYHGTARPLGAAYDGGAHEKG